MNSQKGIGGVALIVILAVVVIAGGAIFYLSGNNSQNEMNVEEVPVVENENTTGNESIGTEEEADAVTIDITGRNFEFSQDEIRVKQGQTVTINFESTQGFHDWAIDEFDVSTEQVNPGEPTTVTFVADQVGEFEYYCSVGNHRQQGMVGTLIVEE